MLGSAPPRPKTKQEATLDDHIETLERVYLDVSFKTDNPNQEVVEACRKVVEYLYQQRRVLNETKRG